jgi:nitrogenase molybdenum-cofactor synthesis protein NifE
MPSNSFHYTSVGCGGWGIVRVGLLVPESGLLFVGPPGCGRHGAIAGIQCGFKKNLSFLHISETDIVTGAHLEKVVGAVDRVLQCADPPFKAFLICATCIDTLLASDYDNLAFELESQHGIPVRVCQMNPITLEGKTPPALTVQQSIYDFLEPSGLREKTINMIGGFAPIMADSEFHQVIADAGLGEVRHIAANSSFRQFQRMSRASHNILIKPGGSLAARDMRKKLGIPYYSMPHSFGCETITRLYHELGNFLGRSLDVERYRRETIDIARDYRYKLGPLRIAVGQAVNANSFELARALIHYGFNVPYIFTDVILETDREHVAWLREHAPLTTVYTNSHAPMVDFRKKPLSVDLAIGFDAGYYCSGAKTAPLGLETQPFGYSAVQYLFREMEKTLEAEQDLKTQIYGSGLVI